MKKTIYICLMTLFFSLSAFADVFNEYDPANGSYGSPYYTSGVGVNDGTGFWGTNVNREVATVKAMGTNAYLYMKEPATTNYYVGTAGQKPGYGWETAKSITEYQYKSGDVIQIFDLYNDIKYDSNGEVLSAVLKLDANGNIQHGFIITNSGSTFQQTHPIYTLQQANTTMMNIFVSEPTRPYFSYNIYNVNTNSLSENIYKATPTGPVIVKSKELRPYSNIPRVVKENVTFAPGSPFMIASSIYNSSNTSYSLYDGYRVVRDYLDYASPDDVIAQFNDGLGLREREILNKVIPKVRESLPADLKPDAESILAMYLEQCDENPNVHPALIMYDFLNFEKVDDIELPANLPFVEGQNYVFDSNGNPKEAGATGNLIQIEVSGVKKSPSELNINDLAQRKALSRVGVFFAKKLKAPIGTIISSGPSSSADPKSIAYTDGRPPHTIRFNYKGGAFNKHLDNIYNFTSVIAHELFHRANKKAPTPVPSNLSTHIDVYLNQIIHTSFAKTTDDNVNDFKLSIIRSMAIYILNMDKKKNLDNTFAYKQIDVKDKMDTFNSLNLHYKLVYPVPDWTRGSLTITIRDINNPLKTPEDANAKYYTINED